MTDSPELETIERFLCQLVDGGDFTDVPMHPDLTFRGPLAATDDAAGYRAICAEFSSAVQAVEVRTLVQRDDVVHAVYDVDIGLPTGALATSQTVRFADGQMIDVEVIFDAARVTGASR